MGRKSQSLCKPFVFITQTIWLVKKKVISSGTLAARFLSIHRYFFQTHFTFYPCARSHADPWLKPHWMASNEKCRSCISESGKQNRTLLHLGGGGSKTVMFLATKMAKVNLIQSRLQEQWGSMRSIPMGPTTSHRDPQSPRKALVVPCMAPGNSQ